MHTGKSTNVLTTLEPSGHLELNVSKDLNELQNIINNVYASHTQFFAGLFC